MIDLNIQWSSPFKTEDENENIQWNRIWLIPINYRPAFFQFWNKSKYKLWNDGFSVKKIDNDWYLLETQENIKDFKKFNKKSIYKNKNDKSEEEFWVPPYKIKNESGLRPWQLLSASKLISVINKIGSAIDGSEMGTGKTYTACGVVRELNTPFVVICPKAVKSQWNNVINKNFNLNKNLIEIINYESLIRGKKDSKIASYLLNKKSHKEEFIWKLPKNTLIIWDEAHKLKNPQAKTTKIAHKALKNEYKMLFLSGSIATNPLELKFIGTSLKLFSGNKKYYEWLYKHGVQKGRWGLEFNNDKKALREIHKLLFEERGTRLKRDDIPDFPECEIIADAYDMDEESTKKINSIYNEMKEELKKIDKKIKNDVENELTIRLRAREKTEIIKIPLIQEMVEEAIQSGLSVVVFLNFSASIEALSKRLNTKCIFDGRVDDTIREQNKKDFQSNKENIIIINSSAGGIGLSIGDETGKYPRISLISPDDSAFKMKQVQGRIWRENSKSKSIQRFIFISNTIEEVVADNVKQKIDNLDLLNDGDLKI